MTSLSETSLLAGASGQSTGYTIDQSIRFDVGASPEMSRTHGTGGNTDLFTLSFWFKRNLIEISEHIATASLPVLLFLFFQKKRIENKLILNEKIGIYFFLILSLHLQILLTFFAIVNLKELL